MSYDVLVTGSSGFLGTAVVRALRARGVRTAESVRHTPGANEADTFVIDLQSGASIDEALALIAPRAIVHLASSMDVSGENPGLIVDTNVVGTLRLLESALANGVDRFVFGSSIMVYGPASVAEGGGAVDERSPTDPRSLYGAAKVFVERLMAEPRYGSRMETACLRFTTIYGPTRTRRGACAFAVDAFQAPTEDGVAVVGAQRTDLVHVDDAAEAVLRALEAPNVSGAYNIGHHEASGASLADVVRDLRPGTRIDLIDGPASSWPSEISSERARTELGWAPTYSLETGAETTIRWFEELHQRA